MEYDVVEKPAFQIVGKPLRVSTKDGENMREIPQFWSQATADGTLDKVIALANNSGVLGNVVLGVCADFAADMSEFTYLIAAESNAAPPDGFAARAVPPLTWAVFHSTGPLPEAIQQVWGHIMSEFFPAGTYRHAAGPDLELYPRADPTEPGYRFEVWVPVEKVR